MLKLSFLGLPKVERSGEPAGHFVSIKALALLCYLAMRDGPQAREHLAGLLWGEMSEARAKANLRMALYHLQKLLPGCLILTRMSAAFNRDQPYWLDVEAFNSGLAAPENQAAILQTTLELYRGEFLEDLFVDRAPEFEVWLLEQREALRLSFVRALERLADQYTGLGDWDASIKTYRRLLAVEPLREEVHRRLMFVLARAGRFDSALEQYERCRRVLGKELQVKPTHESAALYERIQLIRSQPRLHSLPTRQDPLLGREKELVEVETLLRNPGSRLLTLVGLGGIGKSRLALQIAEDQARTGTFLEGVHFIQLASVATADLLASAIADTIQLAFQGPAEPKVQLLNHLHDKEMLLVLDNFEHLIDGGVELLSEILSGASEVKLLTTSRVRLNMREEWLYEVQGLQFPMPAEGSEAGGEMKAGDYPAVQLFVERARRVQPDFSPSETEMEAVMRISQLVKGMPLAIELAASWVRSVSCGKIAMEIERGLGFLAAPPQGMSERHRSMQAVFDHSWRFLSAEEQSVFSRLSVFRGGFRREAAEQVAGATLPILSSLVDKSFLHRDPGGRFEVHELLRQFAEDKLRVIPPEYEETQNLHCRYLASFLHEWGNHLKGGEQIRALKEIGAEIDNIRTAWRWAVDKRRLEEIDKSREGLWGFYDLRCWLLEGEETFSNAVYTLKEMVEERGQSDADGKLLLGTIMARWGWFCWRRGYFGKSKEVLGECLTLLRQAGFDVQREIGFPLFVLGVNEWYLGKYLESKRVFLEAIMVCSTTGNQLILALSLLGLALVARSLGEYAEAETYQQKSLSHFQANNDQRGAANNQIWCGWSVSLAHGDLERAKLILQDNMEISRELQDKFGQALALNHLGSLAHLKGEYLKARQLHRESVEIFQETGDQWGVAYALAGLGFASCALGEHDASRRQFRETLAIAMEIGTLPVALDALVGLAILLHEGEQKERIRALEFLQHVLNHSASSHETKGKATRLINEMEADLPVDIVDTIRKRGQDKTLEAFVDDILRDEQISE